MKIEVNTSAQTPKPEGKRPDTSGGGNLRSVQLLCVGLAVLTVFFGFRTMNKIKELEQDVAKRKAETASLEKELAAFEDFESDEEPADAPQTPEQSRSSRDAALAGDFFKRLLNFKDYESYTAARNWFAETFGADHTILKDFLPELTEEQLGDANMRFEKASTYVVSEDGETRNYFAFCKVTNKINQNTGNGKVAVFYSIDGEGTIGQVSAFTLTR